LAWVLEAGEVLQFGEHAHGGDELYAAHRLQTQYGRIESPADDRLVQGRLKALTLRKTVFNRATALIESQLLPVFGECKYAYPAPVRGTPVGDT